VRPKKRIRVLVADDHPVVREGLRSMLDTDSIEVVGEAGTGLEAVVRAEELEPDVILMDMRMPQMDGASAMAAIKRAQPEVAVIILSTYDNVEYLIRAVVGGAAGYLLKGTPRNELIAAIRCVAAGESLLKRKDLQAVVSRLVKQRDHARSRREGGAERLTDREMEILSLVVQGLTNKQMAELLSVAPSTVKTHVQNIIRKLGVSDRTQAAVWAVREGLTRGQ